MLIRDDLCIYQYTTEVFKRGFDFIYSEQKEKFAAFSKIVMIMVISVTCDLEQVVTLLNVTSFIWLTIAAVVVMMIPLK